MAAFVPSFSISSAPARSSFLGAVPRRVATSVAVPAPRRRAHLTGITMSGGTDSTETPTQTVPTGETYEFQAEVSRVMNLIINSLYSNKEIFLRELVSNASDACDKKRFLSLNAGDVAAPSIYVKADKDSGTVIIEDQGVGMTKQELINNLGSIATSGTSKFMDALGDSGKPDVSLIGQFGVGFYSSYLVADRVTVYSKSYTDPNAKTYSWESSADSSYTVTEVPEGTDDALASSGTRIVLYVKEECKEFIDNLKLTELMKRYSEFIQFPVYGWESRTEFDEVPDGDEKKEDGTPKMKRVPRTEEDWAQVNKSKPLWMRKPKEVTESEYEEFYKTLSKDFSGPLAHTHFAVEGDVEFRALLFCPKVLPPEFRQSMFPDKDQAKSLKLYVKRVFISDNFDDLLPRWLCFLRGVIDSEDMPLNVSREILQKSKVLNTISKRLVRKAIDMFKTIKARDNNDFEEFWKQFGRYIKAGIIETPTDQAEILIKMSLWSSTNSADKLTDLDGYIGRMNEKQTAIYYVAAESRAAGEKAPAMERLIKLGYEVLFMVEPIDELAVQNIATYKAKRGNKEEEESFKFVDVSKEDLNLGELKSDEEKKEDEALKEDFKTVSDFMTKLLANKVGKVETSDKLTESASTIIQSSFGISPTMERYMKEVGASTPGDDPGMTSFMLKARTLEINPKHPIVRDIKSQLENDGEDAPKLKQTCMLVYELALLTAGYTLDDTSSFAQRVGSLVSSSISAPEVIVPPPEAMPPSLDNMQGGGAAGGMPNVSGMPSSMEDLQAQMEAIQKNEMTMGDGMVKEDGPEELSKEMLKKLDEEAEKEAAEMEETNAEKVEGQAEGEEVIKKADTEIVE